jgi:6-pyruvoyltetrahydropterin/6-carboxytetrahydropterin synthase
LVYLTVAGEYNAVHTLWHPDLTRDENYRAFGQCANPAGHGHRFRVELTFGAPVSADSPVVIRRETARRILDGVLAPKLQGADLNDAFGKDGLLPTGENLVQAIWRLVGDSLDDRASLVRVRIVETRKNSFTYAGGESSAAGLETG